MAGHERSQAEAYVPEWKELDSDFQLCDQSYEVEKTIGVGKIQAENKPVIQNKKEGVFWSWSTIKVISTQTRNRKVWLLWLFELKNASSRS